MGSRTERDRRYYVDMVKAYNAANVCSYPFARDLNWLTGTFSYPPTYCTWPTYQYQCKHYLVWKRIWGKSIGKIWIQIPAPDTNFDSLVRLIQRFKKRIILLNHIYSRPTTTTEGLLNATTTRGLVWSTQRLLFAWETLSFRGGKSVDYWIYFHEWRLPYKNCLCQTLR